MTHNNEGPEHRARRRRQSGAALYLQLGLGVTLVRQRVGHQRHDRLRPALLLAGRRH